MSRSALRIGGDTQPPWHEALERDGWDGDWYRRAYYDDGTPLGSASSSECRIDFDCAVVERDVAGRRSHPRCARHGGG